MFLLLCKFGITHFFHLSLGFHGSCYDENNHFRNYLHLVIIFINYGDVNMCWLIC